MPIVFALALKDLRLLGRAKSALFFTFAWPVLIAVGFCLMLGGAGDTRAALSVAVADEDRTPGSSRFLEQFAGAGEVQVHRMGPAEAFDAVRRGQHAAALVLAPGFGAASERVFVGAPPRLRLGIDPSRRAEAAMLEGLLMAHGMAGLTQAMSDPASGRERVSRALRAMPPEEERTGRLAATGRFLGELSRFLADGGGGAAPGTAWTPLQVIREEVGGQPLTPGNTFDYTFPQGVVWGLLGCVMSFAVGLVVERTHGTLVRLQTAPLTRTQVLGGKALACLAATLALQALMFTLGAVAFDVQIASVARLAAAMGSASVAFVGIMMLIAALGRHEQATSAAGWAVLMPLSMVGGGMIPLFVMPAWMLHASHVSPVKWAILAFEGATWRAFGWHELLVPCAVLVGVGMAAFAAGTRLVRTSTGPGA
jgi:ABC-2 type transport system permease protein